MEATTVLWEGDRVTIRETPLPGVLVFEPRVFRDDRGFFLETFREDHLRHAGISASLVQDNHSRSVRDTVRALHFQTSPGQPKLVRCARGSVFDVVVDLRKSSATFGRHFSLELSDENHRQLWIPVGFAHGFCVTSDVADFVYRCGSYYDPETERGILWNSPELGIEWPTDSPLLSDRDLSNPTFSEYPGPWFP
jgi:dTDP-4-dehydrorhamnose 3,5-epimerase